MHYLLVVYNLQKNCMFTFDSTVIILLHPPISTPRTLGDYEYVPVVPGYLFSFPVSLFLSMQFLLFFTFVVHCPFCFLDFGYLLCCLLPFAARIPIPGNSLLLFYGGK